MGRLLLDEKLLSAIVMVVISVLSYISKKLSNISMENKIFRTNGIEQEMSIKRSVYRAEYLSAYNSAQMSIEERYKLCCIIYKKYKKINGNTYIDELHAKITRQYNTYKEGYINE